MKLIPLLLAAQEQHGYLSPAVLQELARSANVPLHRLQQLVSFYPHFVTTPRPRVELAVCRDASCWLAGGESALHKCQKYASGDVHVHEVSCIGRCDRAPAGLFNGHPVTLVDTSLIADWLKEPDLAPEYDLPPSQKMNCDPYATSAQQYRTVQSLTTSDGDRILQQLKESGLRGMGGAGFSTGTKWDFVRRETATPKYVICNADESEPGTFKDAKILFDAPHLVLEGMAIAGLVIGATTGIVFLRHEYTFEKARLQAAIDHAYDLGILGEHFSIEIYVSPGGYILGEETALLECLEDRRGEPRNKPPFPGSKGLYGLPTLINNVETFANVPGIVANGANWWRSLGTEGCPGPKLIAVSGHVEKPGVYQVRLGTTVRELIQMAGGMKDGRPLLAFAPGGASSNFLPADRVDVQLDFNELAKAGSMLGSGALMVIAAGTDLLALATNIVRFFRNESCGKCVPCRVGSEKAVQLLEAVESGKATRQSLDLLPDLAETLTLTSICGLGQVAINPALSIFKLEKLNVAEK